MRYSGRTVPPFLNSSLASLIFGQRPELKEKGDDYRRPLSKRPQAGTKDEQANKTLPLNEFHSFPFSTAPPSIVIFVLPRGGPVTFTPTESEKEFPSSLVLNCKAKSPFCSRRRIRVRTRRATSARTPSRDRTSRNQVCMHQVL